MEYLISTIGFLIISLLTIIGYFLRDSHREIRVNIKETMEQSTENKANIELLQAKSDGKIDELTKVTQLEIKNLAEQIGRILEINQSNSKRLEEKIEHMNNNMKMQGEGMSEMYKKIMSKD